VTPEGKVKREVVALLTKAGAWYCSPITGGYGKSGVPDILACVNGHFIGVECKADATRKPTPSQKMQLEFIERAGGTALVIHKDNLDELAAVLSVWSLLA